MQSPSDVDGSFLSAVVFNRIWDNPEDAVYDNWEPPSNHHGVTPPSRSSTTRRAAASVLIPSRAARAKISRSDR